MAEQIIVLPADAPNTGRKIRVRERVVGANTIVEHYFIPQRERVVEGVYLSASIVLPVNSAADTFPAGRLFIQNPVGSAKLVALRRCHVSFEAVAATVALTAPRIALHKFTFTGAFTGAVQALAKADETAASPAFDIRTANTGAAITSVGIAYAFLPGTILTAVGVYTPAVLDYEPGDDGTILLRAGHGLAVTQPDAGTASDPRRYVVNVALEQFTLP